MNEYITPGIYREEQFLASPDTPSTGVPVFMGLTEKAPDSFEGPETLSVRGWSEFGPKFGDAVPGSFLAAAVRGFFDNGGVLCYVVPLDEVNWTSLEGALSGLESWDEVDLVSAPDIMTPDVMKKEGEAGVLQQLVLDHCDKMNDRFAILDSLPGLKGTQWDVQRVLNHRNALSGINGALYCPWLFVQEESTATRLIPPSGHVAGIYARSDRRVGVNKAPANEALVGVVDLEHNFTDSEQGGVNPEGVNCLRIFPGRGIRVWGARTLSGDTAWTYINQRRTVMTVRRWVERNMAGLAFEPNDSSLWALIARDLTGHLNELFREGVLRGSTASEAFYVKCDAEINPPEVRDRGMVIAEVGLALGVPNERVRIRIIRGAGGVTVSELS